MRRRLEVVEFGAGKAQWVKDCNTYKFQRRLRPNRVAELKEKLRDGRFRTASIAMLTKLDGTCQTMNGQHQAAAVISCGISVPGTIEWHEMEHADTDTDVAELWAQFDEGGTRSMGDVVWGYASAADLGLSKGCAAIVAGGLMIARHGWATARATSISSRMKDKRGRILLEHVPEARFIQGLLFGANANDDHVEATHLRKQPIVATIILCYGKSAGDCEEFWSKVRDGDMLGRNHPAKRLRDWLTTITTVNGSNAKKVVASNLEIVNRCVNAWNAYRDGREVRQLPRFHRDSPSPTVR